ncbi:hypothetical protein [Salinarimonas soli]|nr:hypothetical protein [Salinarimonas soli]
MARVSLFAALLLLLFAFLTKGGASQAVTVLTVSGGFVGLLIMALLKDA